MNEPLELADIVDYRPPRSHVTPLASVCPTCGAARGFDCQGLNGRSCFPHPDRAEGEIPARIGNGTDR